MRKVPLGRSGLEVSRLGFGCMGLAEFYGDALSNKAAEEVLETVLARGVNFLDTADMYGAGRNEEQLSGLLKKHRDKIVLATKFAVQRGDDGEWLGLSNDPAYIKQACDTSLQRLGVDVIDLYYMHRRDPAVPIEDSVGAMAELVKAGKVRAIGLSEVSAQTLVSANAVHPIAAVQSEYSIMTRDMEAEVIPACRDIGAAFVAYSPLGRGILTGAYRSADDFEANDFRLTTSPRFQGNALENNVMLVDRLAELAMQKGVTLAQTALAWVLSKGDDIIPIPGTKKVARLDENLTALTVKLSDDDIAAIEAAVPPEAVAGARYPEGGRTSFLNT